MRVGWFYAHLSMDISRYSLRDSTRKQTKDRHNKVSAVNPREDTTWEHGRKAKAPVVRLTTNGGTPQQ